MKIKFTKNHQTRLRELLILPQKTERLNPKQAAWLKGVGHANYLKFTFDMAADMHDSVLRYNVNGLVSLKSYAKKKVLTKAAYTQMLVDLCQAVICCTRSDFNYFSMLFDPRHVFVDERGSLRFVFVPLDGMTFRMENSPLTLLKALSAKRGVKRGTPVDSMFAERLADYVIGENETFSLNTFRAFIKSECEVDIASNGEIILSQSPSRPPERRFTVDNNPDTFSRGEAVLVRVATGESFPLSPGAEVRLGRGSTSTVQLLGNPKISRAHATLKLSGDALILRDEGSANGTYVAGRRLAPGHAVRVPLDRSFSLATEEFCVRM